MSEFTTVEDYDTSISQLLILRVKIIIKLFEILIIKVYFKQPAVKTEKLQLKNI